MASNDIVKLEYPTCVQKRPGMYIGSTENCSVILREAIDNSVDELYAGQSGPTPCDTVWIDFKDGIYTVADNCRGIPTKESSQQKGWTMARLAVASLHAGSKFNGDSLSIGTNGVGVSCLSPETLITLCDSENNFFFESVSQLSERENYDNIYLISFDERNHELIKTKINRVWETKKVTELVELEFDNGTKVRVTSDHKFLLSSGGYKEAGNLSLDDDVESSVLKFGLSEVFNGEVNVISHCVYRIVNDVTQKSYIGSFIYSLQDRFVNHDWFGQSHKTKFRSGKTELYKDMRQFGVDKFHVEILFQDPNIAKSELHTIEKYYVSKFNSYLNGYNTTKDGDWGSNPHAGVEGNKRKGTNRWNSQYQSDRSFEGVAKSIKEILKSFDDLSSINEISWNSAREEMGMDYSPTYRTICFNKDKYVSKGILTQEESEIFTESRFDLSEMEVFRSNGHSQIESRNLVARLRSLERYLNNNGRLDCDISRSSQKDRKMGLYNKYLTYYIPLFIRLGLLEDEYVEILRTQGGIL